MRKYSLIIMLLLIINAGYSQAVGDRIKHTTLTIFNNSNKDLKIKLGMEAGIVRDYPIKSQEKWISPTYPENSRLKFVIMTNEKEVKYSLKLNSTYMIFWNSRKKYWDLKKIRVRT